MRDAFEQYVYNEIFRTIKERCEEARQESYKNKDDEFKAGRALAYWEMNEIIQDRLEMLKDE